MRKWIVIAFATMALVVGFWPKVAAQSAPTVDEIVTKHLATKGGAEKWKTIMNQKLTGVATMQGFELKTTVYARRPNLSRREMTVEIPGQPTTTVVNIFDGKKAWLINPMSGSSAPQIVWMFYR